MSGKQLGTIGMIGIGWFVVAVLALHVIEPDFSVVDEYMSDYALGEYGWLMRSAFLAAGLGIVAIDMGLGRHWDRANESPHPSSCLCSQRPVSGCRDVQY